MALALTDPRLSAADPKRPSEAVLMSSSTKKLLDIPPFVFIKINYDRIQFDCVKKI